MTETADTTVGRRRIFQEWAALWAEEADAEKKLQRARRKRLQLESQHRFLGTIKGIVKKKEETEQDPQPKKRTRAKEDEETKEPKTKKAKEDPVEKERKAAVWKWKSLKNKILQKAKGKKLPTQEEIRILIVEGAKLRLPLTQEEEDRLAEAVGLNKELFTGWYLSSSPNVFSGAVGQEGMES